MKKMSKLLSGALALALVACMGTTAFAADITSTEGPGNTETGEVKLNATIAETEPTYSVNVAWNNLTFTYEGFTANADWNTTEHKYDTAQVLGNWSNGGTGNVTITNHSDAAVNAKTTYEGDYENGTAKEGVTVKLTGDSLDTEKELAIATPDTVSNPGETQTVVTVNVSGKPDKTLQNVTAGTITVTITAAGE